MNKDQLKHELEKAAKGVLVPNETHAPFEIVYHEKEEGQELNEQLITKLAGKPAGKKVETMQVEQFFNRMLYAQAEAEDTNEETTEQYKNLVSKLNELLKDVKVYLIEEIGTKVFILGKTADGNYAGYETMIVDDKSAT